MFLSSWVQIRSLYLQVFEKLHALFTGFASTGQPPAVFVLMGNFTSHPIGSGTEDHYKLRGILPILLALYYNYSSFGTELFDRLADLIQSIDIINKVPL